ncbi:inactive tyrosine-protein kinase transmembrane receptor ROR1-like [Hydractinia symbiolongicarpus]|uniref:inactive tyrosine-protein kinase transmembrane receptor ROR1-like n=1 Tax=Hydractinia symbiolongicarpus TaxID=13093 RepID=UPI0025503E99|nr:inactive tyrosine-protein kinase transmembrane receptor ROR1-like [Hydractinia symbiolongicarpus]
MSLYLYLCICLERVESEDVDIVDYAYDFWSIMHYGPMVSSKNGLPTIKVKEKYSHLKPKLGQRKSLSYLDIAKVRSMYNCNQIPSAESNNVCVSKATKGRDYRGKLDYTEEGVMCQPWNKKYPHSHDYDLSDKDDGLGEHNYCRNPGGERERPWCFTTLMHTKKQYCDLEMCVE